MAGRGRESLPRQGVMSFGEHLEELRARILRSILAAIACTAVALIFQEDLVRGLTRPHREAMGGIRARQEAASLVRDWEEARQRLAEIPRSTGAAALSNLEERDAREARWREHLRRLMEEGDNPPSGELRALFDLIEEELDSLRGMRQRLHLTARVKETVAESRRLCREERKNLPRGAADHLDDGLEHLAAIEGILRGWKTGGGENPGAAERPVSWHPFERALGALERGRGRLEGIVEGRFEAEPLRLLGYTEAFFSTLKICFLVGLVCGLPWISVELWAFVATGLFPGERRAVAPFIPLSLVGIVAGAVFAYFILIPVGLSYLGSYGTGEILEPAFTLKDYLSLTFALILGMSLVFQLPLVMTFLSRAGFATPEQYRRYRKYSLLGGVALGAILTPPDVVTQLLMAGPLVLL
ncbi:MAG: twin-arginine translocase subunit TatC, partial [Planctomycetota bacterium]